VNDLTAQGAADAGRAAFRLAAPTPLRDKPDVSSSVLETLAPGSLVVVRDDAGPFLFVIAANERFGYIDDDTPVTLVLRPPEADRIATSTATAPEPSGTARALLARAAALDAQPATSSEKATPANPAGELFLREMASGTTLTAAALTGTGGRPHMAGDDTFQLARPLDASERVLIYDRIAANKRSTILLMGTFIVFLSLFFLAIGYYLSYYGGVAPGDELNMSVRIGVAGFLIALAIGMTMYFTAPAAVLMISGAHEVTKEEEPELYRIVENLTIGSGLPMPKVYVIEDSAPNALATGRDPQHACVAATRGLLNKLEKRELEAVMAHEMSHVGNYDIRIMTVIAVAVGLIAMIADLLLRFTWYGSGARSSNRDKGGGAIALLLLAAAFILIVVSPIVASMIRLALSRQREYLADASGALLCRNPDALADALEKISADTEPLEVANKATAHMYIENPLKEHGSFLNNLFATHPPAQERIRLLRAMA